MRGLTEEGKVALRNIRRDVMHDLKELRTPARPAPTTSTAPKRRCRSSPTRRSKELDALLKAKEAEILEV